MKLVWYQWVSFVELFVTRRANPEGFSSAIEIFRQEAAQICREELGSSACGLKYPGSLNLPVLAQQNLAVGFTTFYPSATVLCSPAMGKSFNLISAPWMGQDLPPRPSAAKFLWVFCGPQGT